jgi:hypothetical protein
MLLKNKDLNLVLNSFLRSIRQTRQNLCRIPTFAIVLMSDGKLAQFSGQSNRALTSASDTLRYLERGVYTLVREGRCKAIGIPCEVAACAETSIQQVLAVLLEHQDGSAYRVQFPCSNNGSIRIPLNDLVHVVTEPKFFLGPRVR